MVIIVSNFFVLYQFTIHHCNQSIIFLSSFLYYPLSNLYFPLFTSYCLLIDIYGFGAHTYLILPPIPLFTSTLYNPCSCLISALSYCFVIVSSSSAWYSQICLQDLLSISIVHILDFCEIILYLFFYFYPFHLE